MASPDEDFLRRLRETFRQEAEEHLRTISGGLPALEREKIEMIFRAAHSLKGAARSVNLPEVETICQALESVFAALKRELIRPSQALLDLLDETLDELARLIHDETPDARALARGRALIRRLEAATHPSPDQTLPLESPLESSVALRRSTAAHPPPPGMPRAPARAVETPRPGEQTIRVSVEKLDALLFQGEELIGVKLAAWREAEAWRAIARRLAAWREEEGAHGAQLSLARIDAAPRSLKSREQLAAQQARALDLLSRQAELLSSLHEQAARQARLADQEAHTTSALVEQLLGRLKRVVTVPLDALLESLPKLVRDLARDEGKSAELIVEGGEIEIDRRILEALKDPLTHLMRNAVDHGLERPEERARAGKPARGSIEIRVASISSNQIEILVRDDGRGIDLARVRERGRAARLLGPNEVDDDDALRLIFLSGFSTREMITDISGRGLGLAILRERVERLGGAIAVETERGVGTTFRLLLPLTLATFRGLLVAVGERQFIIPTASVERVIRVEAEEVRTIANRETIRLGETAVPLVPLARALELPERSDEGPRARPALVIAGSGRRVVCTVDEVRGEQEVLVKSLGRQLARVRNVAGATVTGDGQVVPVLNSADLVRSAHRLGLPRFAPPAPEKEAVEGRRRILIAEDSVTARALLKNILETAGYEIETAPDGLEAFMRLQVSSFDLVVSDVEMPRLNGFELVSKIRADRALSELPVVLVTALASAEDRRRGVEVGANAYLVKSDFEQSDLLEVIARLI